MAGPSSEDWDQLIEAVLRKVRASASTFTSTQDAKLTAEALMLLAQATKHLAEAEEIRRRTGTPPEA